jgi:hypothetical protein
MTPTPEGYGRLAESEHFKDRVHQPDHRPSSSTIRS